MLRIFKLSLPFLFVLALTQWVSAQTTKPTFFEKAPNDFIRFFLNKDYYLVDKNCEFKFIERVAKFDIASNKFNGAFKDFDPNGKMILSGNYVDGKKEGIFEAYYPNGAPKWKITFKSNVPIDTISYFYPDGKPLLTLQVFNQNIYIKHYWNKLGQQKVINGEGYMNISLPIIGFTEHGFSRYATKGKVKDGLQEGLWYTSFVQEDRKPKETPLMVSAYENGVLRNREIDEFFEPMLIDFNSFSFIPQDLFTNAELLQSKGCSFDEFTGFNSYIAQKFMQYLKSFKFNALNIHGDTGLSYKIRVNKKGIPYSPTLLETSRELSSKEKMIFNQMINQIPYYLPSYAEGKPIDDVLVISLAIGINGDEIQIYPVQIKREKGL